MKIKLKETIRAGGIQYRPTAVHIEGQPAGVVDSNEIGITDADVEVLVRRGTAELVTDGLVEGHLAGVVENDGTVKALEDLSKAELVKLAADMGIETAGKTKAELAEAIKAEPSYVTPGE